MASALKQKLISRIESELQPDLCSFRDVYERTVDLIQWGLNPSCSRSLHTSKDLTKFVLDKLNKNCASIVQRTRDQIHKISPGAGPQSNDYFWALDREDWSIQSFIIWEGSHCRLILEANVQSTTGSSITYIAFDIDILERRSSWMFEVIPDAASSEAGWSTPETSTPETSIPSSPDTD